MSQHLLLVEPSGTQAQLLSLDLAEEGFHVDTAPTAAAAKAFLKRTTPNAVLVNFSLPDGTGSQLCRDIKTRNAGVHVLVIAESGNATQILESLAAGADAFWMKSGQPADLPRILGRTLSRPDSGQPVISQTVAFDGHEYDLSLTPTQWLDVLVTALGNLAELKERCCRLSCDLAKLQSEGVDRSEPTDADGVDDPVAGDTPIPDADRRTTEAVTVLLAEDSPTNRILGSSLLAKAGYHVLTANNGHEVLARLDGPDADDITFILMDVQMPEMDGLEATRLIRQRERDTPRHMPVFAMTAHSAEEEQQACLDAGMDACLEKPLRIDAVSNVFQQASRQSPREQNRDGPQ